MNKIYASQQSSIGVSSSGENAMTSEIPNAYSNDKCTSNIADNANVQSIGNTASNESIFELALRAKNERLSNPSIRFIKAPSKIKATTRVNGWFRTHPDFLLLSIDIFHPKDESGFSDEPIFVVPEIADLLRSEGSLFENALREHMAYLVITMVGALYLVLVPLPDPVTGRYHAAVEQKLKALEAARIDWKRLDWNKNEKQYDDFTASGIPTEPKWPEDVSPASILNRTFGERNVIKSIDDPLILRFRGEA